MLLCCVNFILVHAPKSHRRISLTDPSIIASNAASVAISREEDRQEQPIASPDGVNNLPYLCTIFKANNDELSEVQNRLFAPFLRLVGAHDDDRVHDVVELMMRIVWKEQHLKVRRRAAGRHVSDDITASIDIDRLYFDNLLVGENLIRNKNQMNIEYDYIYYESGDIDERLFLDQVEHIGTPSKIQSAYYHRNNDQVRTSPRVFPHISSSFQWVLPSVRAYRRRACRYHRHPSQQLSTTSLGFTLHYQRQR